jgi:hypothetical protein
MKKLLILLALSVVGCGSTAELISKTGNPNEYLINTKNLMPKFSSIEEAQDETVNQAKSFCGNLSKKYTKVYTLEKPKNLGGPPESTLYFTCTDLTNTNN